MASAAVREYWSDLIRLNCIVHGGCPAEIAHAHGASIVERMQEPKAKGKKLERYDWLVLPLCPPIHRLGGRMPSGERIIALDADPEEWERRYGRQATYIDMLCRIFNRDLWALARRK